MEHEYISQNQVVSRKNKAILFALGSLVIVAVVGVLVFLGGNHKNIDALSIVQKFINAGLPVENVVVFNEQTDPNNSMGSLHGYTSKVSFADSRLEQYSSDPEGGTVEVFKNLKDATARYNYTSSFSGTAFASYVFQYGNVVTRISIKLTPEQAELYNAVLLK